MAGGPPCLVNSPVGPDLNSSSEPHIPRFPLRAYW
jgi:hypothetical protein